MKERPDFVMVFNGTSEVSIHAPVKERPAVEYGYRFAKLFQSTLP